MTCMARVPMSLNACAGKFVLKVKEGYIDTWCCNAPNSCDMRLICSVLILVILISITRIYILVSCNTKYPQVCSYSSILLSRHNIIIHIYTRHAIDLQVHESCMHVAVKVLHSCAFITNKLMMLH